MGGNAMAKKAGKAAKNGLSTGPRKGFAVNLKKYWVYYAMLLIPFIQLLLFKYKPMVGVVTAFQDYNKFKGMFGSEWIGFAHFQELFSSSMFWTALKNTIVLNLGDLILGFPLPIALAIFLFEVKSKRMKTATMMVTYLPHFLSWVIIAGIIQQVFSNSGMVNNLLAALGLSKINFLTNPQIWRVVYWIAGIWQNAGYSLIIYMAALSGVDTSLYEAAYLDGASRLQRIWYVTLPQISATITTMLIMQLGKIVAITFDRPYMLSNTLVKDTSEVISTYVYSVGLGAGRFDYATAVGLFQTVVGVIMVLSVNAIIKKMGEEGIL